MRSGTRNALRQLQEEGAIQELSELLLKRYWEEWLITSSVEERERIFLKTQMVDELLTELFTILDSNRETEDG